MSTHTPGPWVTFPSRIRWQSDRKPIFNDGLWHVLPENDIERLPICEVDHADDHDEPTRQKAECDARLIAAAPELLAACKEALGAFENNNAIDWNDLRRAIDKAEGRT